MLRVILGMVNLTLLGEVSKRVIAKFVRMGEVVWSIEPPMDCRYSGISVPYKSKDN